MALIDEDDEFYSAQDRRGRAFRFGLVLFIFVLLLTSMLGTKTMTTLLEVYIGITVGVMALLAIGLVRSFRVGFTLSRTGIVARSTYATRQFPWDALRGATTSDHSTRGAAGPFAAVGPQRDRIKVVPVLVLRSGREARLYGLQTISFIGNSSWVDEAMEAVNERLEELRGPRPR